MPTKIGVRNKQIQTWKTTQVIERKIVKPAERLIRAQAGIEKLFEH